MSLLIGHRESEDLDFFTKKIFDPLLLQQKISELGKLENVSVEEGTLNAYFDGVKLQFLYYPYNLLEEVTIWNNINLSSLSDIACTKLLTISMRGSKKDFVDLYYILKTITLDELFEKLEQKYSDVQYNTTHILKSLVYFNDADLQPMPRMIVDADWQNVKESIVIQVQSYSF